jgi:hypothetical protein
MRADSDRKTRTLSRYFTGDATVRSARLRRNPGLTKHWIIRFKKLSGCRGLRDERSGQTAISELFGAGCTRAFQLGPVGGHRQWAAGPSPTADTLGSDPSHGRFAMGAVIESGAASAVAAV